MLLSTPVASPAESLPTCTYVPLDVAELYQAKLYEFLSYISLSERSVPDPAQKEEATALITDDFIPHILGAATVNWLKLFTEEPGNRNCPSPLEVPER